MSDWYRPLPHGEKRFVIVVAQTGLGVGGGDRTGTMLPPLCVEKEIALQRPLTPGEGEAEVGHAGGSLYLPFGHSKEDLNQSRRASRTPQQLQFTAL